MKRLAIVGAAELGCLVAHHARLAGTYDIVGFFDDRLDAPRHRAGGAPVLGKVEDVRAYHADGAFDELMIGIGYAAMDARRRVFDRFADHVPMGRVVHPSCYVDPLARLGRGVFLMPGCVVDLGAELADNVTCQVGCLVSHHTTIREHAFLGPGVRLAGYVTVGPAAFVGIGAVVKDGIEIGDGSIVGAGAVVIEPVPASRLVVGVPAKVIREL